MHLPKILYISDVPVELSYAGATLMYRLLEEYPKDKLLIVQGMTVNNNGRIFGVKYFINTDKFLERLEKTRFSAFVKLLSFFKSLFFFPKKYRKIIDDFKPEIILTIPFRTMWLSASKLSKQLNIPVHLILHDDFLITEKYGLLQPVLQKMFSNVYRQAVSRLCISPAMELHYRQQYKVAGEILYPLRSKDDKSVRADQKKIDNKNLIFCYAGSVNTSDFISMLDDLAGKLESINAKLILFSPIKKESLNTFKHLYKSHVSIKSMVHPDELKNYMLENVDVNILLNSFEQEESFKFNFSSKLVDYTILPMPILFWGPSTSGAIDWAKKNEYDLVLTDRKSDRLDVLLQQLLSAEIREQLGKKIQKIGEAYFDYHTNRNIFISAIQSKK